MSMKPTNKSERERANRLQTLLSAQTEKAPEETCAEDSKFMLRASVPIPQVVLGPRNLANLLLSLAINCTHVASNRGSLVKR